MNKNWREDAQLAAKFKDYRTAFLKILKQFESIETDI